MGCFSFLCKISNRPALSTSFDGSPCRLFLLKDGKVIEEMHGNYDSYGQVFQKGKEKSFKWKMDWDDVCNLMFHSDRSNGIAMVLDEYWAGEIPTTRSEDDPNQGWGEINEDEEDLMGNTDNDMFPEVTEPYHKVY